MASPFLIASKVFWTFLKPETWFLVLILIALAAVLAGRRRLAGVTLAVTALAFLAVGIVPVGDLLLRPIEQRFPVHPPVEDPAAILVLGGGEESIRSAATGLIAIGEAGDRFFSAIALARRFPEAKVIFTGGTGWFVAGSLPGSEVARRIFDAAGIAPDRVILEGRSRNTWQNAEMTLPLVQDLGPGPVVLVTSAFHMPRAAGVFCAAGWSNLIAWPDDVRAVGTAERWGWGFAVNLQELNLGVKEWIGTLAYRLTGQMVPVSSDNGRVVCGPRA